MHQIAALLLLFILLTVGCKSEPPEEKKAPIVEAQTEQKEGNRSAKEESSVPPRWANEEEILAEAPKVELVTREIEWLNDEVFLVEVPQDATIKVEFDGAKIQLPSGAEAELRVGTRNLVEFESYIRRASLAEEISFSGKHMILWKSSWSDERPFCATVQTTDSVRDYVVQVSKAEALSDCILLLKCLKSYRPKTPYPEEIFKLLSRLDITYTPKSDDPNKITELDFGHNGNPCAQQFLLVTRFPNLESLEFEQINFGPREQPLEPLLNLSKLQSFRIKSSLDPEHMKSLSMIPTLQHLNVMANESESWFASLGKMTGLKTLSLSLVSEPIEIVGLRHLANCKDLEELTLGTNLQDKNIASFEEALEVLSRLPKLRKLALNPITGPISERISSLRSLESLEINPLEQTAVENFGTLAKTPKLKSLTLDGTWTSEKARITPEAIQHLGTAPLFETLKISNLPLGENELAGISRLPNLAELTLDAENLTPVSLMKFKDAPKLRKLKIRGYCPELTRDVMNEFKQAAPQIMLID